ncbi:sensor histidine kinase [Sediminispirochaeta bajacaliforniensis]|uniref:sensor histidine kinase n=1 Tax=Sediminispirochaeta bajacaliforniensis TaxID=148 RepID=UPI0003773959|nr:histidine kinase dimerization/phosphoacceptor domain -containing protein [Sediminispirochaeta bajacaliforniensis]
MRKFFAALFFSLVICAPEIFCLQNLTVVGGANGNVPYEYLDDKGRPRGILVDIWDLWSKESGVEVSYLLVDNIKDVIDLAGKDTSGPIVLAHDRIPGFSDDAGRFEHGEVYYEVRPSIFYHKRISGIVRIEEMAGYVVGVAADSGIEEPLAEAYPYLVIRSYDSRQALLAAVLSHQIHLFVGYPPSIIHEIGITGNARAFRSGKALSFSMPFAPVLVKGPKELLENIQEGFSSMNAFARSLAIHRQTGFFRGWSIRWPLIAAVGLVLMVGLLFSLFWFWKLQLDNRIRQATDALVEQRRQLETSRDALAHALREKEILLKEIHHRVKNNLQIISSLANLIRNTGGTTDEGRDPFAELQSRVVSMAKVHEVIYTNEQFEQVPLRDLIKEISELLISSIGMGLAIRLSVTCDNLAINVGDATAFSLIIHEAVTNAIKHAFASGRNNILEILVREINNTVVLCIKDNGAGFPAELDFDGKNHLGLFMIKQLATQLRGELALDNCGYEGSGAQITVRFPLPEARFGGLPEGNNRDYLRR